MTEDPMPKGLYSILACPICKSDLGYTKDKEALHCGECGKDYPVKEGIPVFL